MIAIPGLPAGIRRQIRGLLGNTTGETDIIKVLAISGFVFAHVMIWRQFNIDHKFGITDYAVGLSTILGTVAVAFRLRGDHDTPDTPGATT